MENTTQNNVNMQDDTIEKKGQMKCRNTHR